MKVRLTRDSVCAGDDCDAPHLQEFSVPDGTSLLEIMRRVKRDCLATIGTGSATWSAFSIRPLAVLAQEREEPSMLWHELIPGDFRELDFDGKRLKLHLNYHMQISPDVVVTALKRVHRTTIGEP